MGRYIIKKVPETTNNLTSAIINCIRAQGFVAYRINTTGIYDAELGVWRKGGSSVGVFDVLACVNSKKTGMGVFVAIDIKKGKDRLSKAQEVFMNEINGQNGFAFTVSSYTQFIEKFQEVLSVI